MRAGAGVSEPVEVGATRGKEGLRADGGVSGDDVVVVVPSSRVWTPGIVGAPREPHIGVDQVLASPSPPRLPPSQLDDTRGPQPGACALCLGFGPVVTGELRSMRILSFSRCEYYRTDPRFSRLAWPSPLAEAFGLCLLDTGVARCVKYNCPLPGGDLSALSQPHRPD